ncbi:MAG: class I SAM-dependent methyltransferase [Chthonomonas sp.]|nr:class I SAM-dependent methyltransferase [Chthonomonas sp.]
MTHSPVWDKNLSQLRQFLTEACLSCSDEQIARFATFREALYDRNEVMNLTRVPPEGCELRHFIDSLLFVDMIPTGARVLDIGTGPGLPAWPLANARPDLDVVALDSSGKMLSLLRSQPLPNVEVVEARMEDANLREEFDVVTGRALAPLPIQLELSAAAAKVGGAVIPMRSSNDLEVMNGFVGEGLGLSLESHEVRLLPGTDVARMFPVYRKTEATQPRYPRKWADIKRKPLV